VNTRGGGNPNREASINGQFPKLLRESAVLKKGLTLRRSSNKKDYVITTKRQKGRG